MVEVEGVLQYKNGVPKDHGAPFLRVGLCSSSFVSIRAPAWGAIQCIDPRCLISHVSIRAPAWGAMATHSKIRPLRALTPPLSSQNQHNLGNPFPHSRPCSRPLREKTSRFYDHLRFALEPSFGLSHHFCVAVANFGRPRPNDLLLVYHVTQPSNAFDLTRQSTTSPNLSFDLSTEQHLQKV